MSVVDEIKERLDLVEIIGRYVPLLKAGRNFKGVCPFHGEKTPSFFVFPDNQRWHCFGCNKGGDLFTFIMEREGWDFHTTIEELGRQAGVEIRPRTEAENKAVEENERLRAALQATAELYHIWLMKSPQAAGARSYLERRGFTQETLERFHVGYSLSGWDSTRTTLLGKGFTVAEQIKAGILVEKDDGGSFDRFRNRLMIPICDRHGLVVGFGGRALAPDDQPKYMNSPQTPLFDKSKILFGMHLARDAIRDSGSVVIVEGYMDVMIAHQGGFANVVAPMGTALTETHLRQLQRMTRRFILALDPDAAGIEATMRGMEVARDTLDRQMEAVFDPQGLVGYEGRLQADIRALTLPDGLDPDELILQDPDRWRQMVADSQPIVRFYFQQLLQREDPREPKGKARIVDAMLPLLRDLSNSVEREAYAQEIALKLGLDARSLLDRLRARDRAEAVRREAQVTAPGKKTQRADLEAYILQLLIRYPPLLERVYIRLVEMEMLPLQTEDFSPSARLIYEAWLEVMGNPEQELEALLPPDLQEQVRTWQQAPLPELPLNQWESDLMRVILRVREKQLDDMKRQIQTLLTEAQADGDAQTTLYYAAHLQELSINRLQVQQALARKL